MKSVIGDAALLSAFRPLESYTSAALAVSGGPDSMALMLLIRRWIEANKRSAASIAVLTVNHGLRDGSANEAAFVAKRAESLGFRHVTLNWEGEKPKTGIQAAARQARYRLMADFCRSNGIHCLVTAHTEDDQAETLLMRLRRGSGLDGLAAMAAVSLAHGIPLIRPLLGFSKARLEGYLKGHAAPFIGDPSNENSAFERVRLRNSMQAFAIAGFARPALSLAASRLGRAREALAFLTDHFLESEFRARLIGQGLIDRQAFEGLPEELAVRALSRMLALVGGKEQGPQMAKVERALRLIGDGKRQTAVGGCLIVVTSDNVEVYREPGRMQNAILPAEGGTSCNWDGRFILAFEPALERGLTVAPLGDRGWGECRSILGARSLRAEIDRVAALTVPALWNGTSFAGAPSLAFVHESLNGAFGHLAKVELAPRLRHFLKPE